MKKNRDLRGSAWRVGDLVVDERGRTVRRGSEAIKLPRLSFAMLLELIRSAPDPVSTDDLMGRVWGDVVVGPGTVAKRVELLRQALGDDSENPRYIALEHGYGYRLIVEPTATASAGAPIHKRYKWLFPSLGVAMLVLLVAAGLYRSGPSVAPSERSIAILPLKALGDGAEDQYIADGFTVELNRALARQGGIRVVGRSSSFRYRDSPDDAIAIGRALNVAYLLEGSIRRDDVNLRLVANLTDTSDGNLVWSGAFDRNPEDIITVQEELADSIVSALSANLGQEPQSSEISSDNHEAHMLYLKAVSLMEYPFGSDLPRAQVLLEQAVSLDPGFARGWSWLAAVHLRRQLWREPTYQLSPTESVAAARNAVDRALAANPEEGTSYAVLAAIAWIIEGDIAKAADLTEQFGRYNYWELNYMKFAADIARTLGQTTLARDVQARVIARDPLCVYCRIVQLDTYETLGQTADAVREARMLIQLEPERPVHQFNLGKALLLAEKADEAADVFAGISNETMRLSGLAMASFSSGDFEEADRLWLELQPCELDLYTCAELAAWLGHNEQALEWLNDWVARPDFLINFQTDYLNPVFSDLHDLPAWNDLLRRIGRSPEQLAGIDFAPPLQSDTPVR